MSVGGGFHAPPPPRTRRAPPPRTRAEAVSMSPVCILGFSPIARGTKKAELHHTGRRSHVVQFRFYMRAIWNQLADLIKDKPARDRTHHGETQSMGAAQKSA